MCLCGSPGCFLTGRKNHFCTVCQKPHYTTLQADDCCDAEVATDD